MIKKSIFIKTKASKIDGWGNLQRQFNIFQILDKRKYQITFFFQGSRKGYNFLKSKCKTVYVPYSFTYNQEINLIKKAGSCDYFIIEQLKIPIGYQRKLKKITNKLIIFDDLLDNNYCCDILFCCQENNNFDKVIKNQKNKIRKFNYGYKYFPISRDLQIQKKKISTNKINNNIIISLGGGGYDKYIENSIKVLSNYDKYFDKIIIFLKGVYNTKIIKYLNKYKYIYIKKDKLSVLKDINISKLSILSGGYHKIESNYLRSNSLFISTQKHQDVLLKKFAYKTNSKYIKYNSVIFNKELNHHLTNILIKNKNHIKYIIKNNNTKFLKSLLN